MLEELMTRKVLLIAAMVLVPFSNTVVAEPGCVCIDGYGNPSTGSTTCTTWDCDPVIRKSPFTSVKSDKDCPENRQLFCDGKKCFLGCPAEDKLDGKAKGG
jgi:hypothetical protein